jgi:hypothetical protein
MDLIRIEIQKVYFLFACTKKVDFITLKIQKGTNTHLGGYAPTAALGHRKALNYLARLMCSNSCKYCIF